MRGLPTLCPSRPSHCGWMQRGRRGACVIRGEKPQAIASHGTGSGKPDVVSPLPFPLLRTMPATWRQMRLRAGAGSTIGAAYSAAWHCGSLRARPCSVGRLLKGPSRSCRKSHPAIRKHSRRPQRAPLSARAGRVVPVFLPWRYSPARRRISLHVRHHPFLSPCGRGYEGLGAKRASRSWRGGRQRIALPPPLQASLAPKGASSRYPLPQGERSDPQ